MEYKKIENEIDNLLHNGGLNPYEKKLLRKVKRKFCFDHRQKLLHIALNGFMDSEITRLEQEIEVRNKALKICYFYGATIFFVSVATIAYCLLK